MLGKYVRSLKSRALRTIHDCAATVDPVPSITRHFVKLSREQKERVYEQMKEFSFFTDYSYDD